MTLVHVLLRRRLCLLRCLHEKQFSLLSPLLRSAVRDPRLKKMAEESILIDSSPLLLSGPPSPEIDVFDLDAEEPKSALAGLAWPPPPQKVKAPPKKKAKAAAPSASTRKAPTKRKKKKQLLSTVLPPEKAVASVQHLASSILYPPSQKAREEVEEVSFLASNTTPDFRTKGWRKWLSDLATTSRQSAEKSPKLWGAATGESDSSSALYQSRALAHAQTMAFDRPSEIPDVCTQIWFLDVGKGHAK